MFMEKLTNTLNQSKVRFTENGALGYATTGHKILDINFKLSSYRNLPDSEIVKDFLPALYEDPITAIKFLFFVRDVRGGTGERRFFRVILRELASISPELVIRLLPLVGEYGRYDDSLSAFNGINAEIDEAFINLVKSQLSQDWKNMMAGKSVSLLAKWMPTENCSSLVRRNYARAIISKFGCTPREYRKMLSTLRAYLKEAVVETFISSNRWGDIQYPNVSSQANKGLKNAFLRHDEERRRDYLSKLDKGETKINASTLFPHDILHEYEKNGKTDLAVEGMWKALPNYVKDNNTTLVVADGSGSMYYTMIGNTSMCCGTVANALAIYFAERCSGEFKDKYITFSRVPEIVTLCGSLLNKVRIAKAHDKCENTNIKAVFDLILKTAVNNKMSQEDLPKNILIISDMEFDSSYGESKFNINQTLFKEIEQKYNSFGYVMPKLAFWNVASRTNAIPVQNSTSGVALVSGFSPAVVSMILSSKTDPYEALLEKLDSDRYKAVEEALK